MTLEMSVSEDDEESIPFAMVERMHAGEPPLTVWREHRGLTIEVFAGKSVVSVADVHAIEAGAEPQPRVAAALAKALGIDAEDLIPWSQD